MEMIFFTQINFWRPGKHPKARAARASGADAQLLVSNAQAIDFIEEIFFAEGIGKLARANRRASSSGQNSGYKKTTVLAGRQVGRRTRDGHGARPG
jgi:hypothetical protein